MTATTIVGLGAMGSALARALLVKGGDVTVWNRTAEKAAALKAAGGKQAGSLEGAIAASPVAIFCIKSHAQTRMLCAKLGSALHGKTIVDLSTGSAAEAQGLADELGTFGARWQIGMINVYPRDIGTPEASIFTVGPEDVWHEVAGRLTAMAGASRRVGNDPKMLAALFAAMFTTRQGYMCGMLHGAAVARAAGLSPEVFAETLPVSLSLAAAYAQTFRNTVLKHSYDDPGASIDVYLDAFEDALATFEMFSAPSDLPRLMHRLVHEAAEAGLGDQELTAVYKMLVDRIPQ